MQNHKKVNMKSIGIIFNIDELGGGIFASKAWRIVMKTIDQEKILSCVLSEGETLDSLQGGTREYCICITGFNLDVDYISNAFLQDVELGFTKNKHRIQLGNLDSEPLIETGKIDDLGQLVQDEWEMRFQERCADCGWMYAPIIVPSDISKEIKMQLKALSAKNKKSDTQTQSKKSWWQIF